MEEIPITRAYLESLTSGDLFRMADNSGIDIPPGLDRIFIIEELLESVSEDEPADPQEEPSDPSDPIDPRDPRNPPEASTNTSVGSGNSSHRAPEDSFSSESAHLPKQYNITFIEVMIRDPLWAFVFWEIKAQDKEQFEAARDFDGYYLKVSPWLGAAEKETAPLGPEAKEKEGIFTVPIKLEDSAWYLGLTPVLVNRTGREDQRYYKVELCVSRKGEETILAVSCPFALPGLPEAPAGNESRSREKDGGGMENPLLLLSGYEDFHILRNNERSLRAKRGSSKLYE